MPVPEISPDDLRAVLALPRDDRPVLLDVRTRGEHAHVALPGSLLIPLQELHERRDELEVLKGRAVVVYCHHGVRSASATNYLRELGVDARSLAGGIDLYSQVADPTLPRY